MWVNSQREGKERYGGTPAGTENAPPIPLAQSRFLSCAGGPLFILFSPPANACVRAG